MQNGMKYFVIICAQCINLYFSIHNQFIFLTINNIKHDDTQSLGCNHCLTKPADNCSNSIKSIVNINNLIGRFTRESGMVEGVRVRVDHSGSSWNLKKKI